MEKVCIVSEKNTVSNDYHIQTIVIFHDNKAPNIIEYKDVQDLMPVVVFAEKKGFDLLKDGIKPSLDAGIIQVISKSNEKEIARLNVEIKDEQLKYSNNNKVLENKNDILEIEKLDEDSDLTDDYVGYVEYLKLFNLRLAGNLTEEGYKEINKLRNTNSIVSTLEVARDDVIRLNDAYIISSKNKDANLESIKNELNNKKKIYSYLREKYRNDLINMVNRSEVKENNDFNKQEDVVGLNMSDEDKQYASYLRLNLLRKKRQLSPNEIDEIKRLRSINKIVNVLETLRDNVIESSKKAKMLKNIGSIGAERAEKELNINQKVYDDTFEYYRNEFFNLVKNNNNRLMIQQNVVEEPKFAGNNVLDPFKTRDKVSIIVPVENKKQVNEEKPIDVQDVNDQTNEEKPIDVQDVNDQTNEEKPIDVQENNEQTNEEKSADSNDKNNFVLVDDRKAKNLKELNLKNNLTVSVGTQDKDGNKIKVLVKVTSKLKEFFEKFCATFLGIVSGVKEFFEMNDSYSLNESDVQEEINDDKPSEVSEDISNSTVSDEVREIAQETITNNSISDESIEKNEDKIVNNAHKEIPISSSAIKQELLELRKAALENADVSDTNSNNKILSKKK